MSGRFTTSMLLLAASGATELVVFDSGHSAVRAALALAFLLFVPGWAFLQLLAIDLDHVTRIGLAVGISLGLDMAVVTALIYARLWSVELGLSAVVLGVVAAVLLDLPPARSLIERGVRLAWRAMSEGGRS
jgi:uncharacterized membrane protein